MARIEVKEPRISRMGADDSHTGWIALATLWAALTIAGCGSATPAEHPADERLETTTTPTSPPLGDERPTPPAEPVAQRPPVATPDPQPEPGRVHRRSDNRPRHDDDRLAAAGIRKYESKRLVLYTDVDAATARALPPLVDELVDACTDYFGELPPTREGTPFQITGYLMREPDRFEQLGLVPRDLPRFLNGRHRDYEFWMYDQDEAYYRRHLLLHEATHCFTTCVPGVRMPIWYLEGLAELFATHRLDEAGQPTFRVMPHDKHDFAGLGRIAMIQDAVAEGRRLSMPEVAELRAEDYLRNESYAWAWAMCRFFDGHPAYAERFRKLGGQVVIDAADFETRFQDAFGKDAAEIATGWAVFTDELVEGYDQKRNAIVFAPGKSISEGTAATASVEADRGWQSSGLAVERGATYAITATGRFTLADEPQPWISEANGVSFRYHRGEPLGRLLAAVRDADPESLLEVTPLGNTATFTPTRSGTLYLRLNDSPAERADNAGTVEVTVRRGE